MSDKSWKKAERRAAKLFGATGRAPLSGRGGKLTASDTMHERLFLEVKQRRKHGVWTWWQKAKELAAKEKKQGGGTKVPVVVLDQVRSPGALIVVHSDDLEAFAREVLTQRGWNLRGAASWEWK